MSILKPPRLRHGDCIGLVSPASPLSDASRINRGVQYLESLGYRTVVGKSVAASHGYLAGTDEQRVADIHTMFRDKDIRAIFCVRGGYGTPRLLHLLDYRLIARHPKILLGYSDITALQLALWRKTGLITFHGPMAGTDMADPLDPFTEELLWSLLTSPRKHGPISLPTGVGETLVPGSTSGHLLGGNLALLVTLFGTPFVPDYENAILFLEDTGEEPYRVDRMLAQLRNASIFRHSRGVLSGQFTDCVPQDRTKPSLTVEEVLRDVAQVAKKPWIANLPFGHDSPKMTMPVGLRVRINAEARQVEYMESAVS